MPFITGKTVTDIFLKRAQLTPNLIGFQYKIQQGASRGEWRDVTFREFFVEVKSIAYGLIALGLQPGERVAIFSQTRVEWSAIDMAVLGAKAISVPIYPSSTLEDIAYVLNNSGSRFICVENEQLLEKIYALTSGDSNLIPGVEKIILIDPTSRASHEMKSLSQVKDLGRMEESKKPRLFESNLEAALPSDLISIVYTSGTTGIPKGAMITHANMASVLDDALVILSNFSEPESETVLSFLPFSHIFGKVESIAVHVFGWKQAFAEDIDKLLTHLTEIRPTIILCVPRTFEKAYQRVQAQLSESSYATKRLYQWGLDVGRRYHEVIREKKMPSPRQFAEYGLAKKLVFSRISDAFGGRLRFAICGGAPLPKELGEFFLIAGIKILEGYGLTETCGPVAFNTPDSPRFGTVGRPMSEVSARIADDGEIEIQSQKVFPGYYQAPEETRAVMDDGWFKTGDVGFIDDDGFLHITDRKKDLIVTSGGKNIAPQKMESAAKSHQLIHQMVVVGDRRPYVAALITLNREQLIRFASEKQILFSEYAELIRNPKIIALMQKVIDDMNRSLAQYETIKKFTILPDDFTVEKGELTPSLKLKRRIIETRYHQEIQALYT
jgi:long-chain acyl-CoA synthetase